MSGDLQQFMGATVLRIAMNLEDGLAKSFYLELRLPDDSTRDIQVYCIEPGSEPFNLCVRIDGMYVPDNEL